MNSAFLVTLLGTGCTVAFLHAAIPTHWLPFVAVGHARGWSSRQTLLAVVLAGGGHVLITTTLGIALARFGFEFSERFDHAFHWAVAAILVAVGAWLAFRAPHGASCAHCHGPAGNLPATGSDRAALWGLVLTLTLSPCELFLPVYLTATPYGWPGIVWLSSVLACATLGAMVGFTWLTLRGARRIPWLSRVNDRMIGGLLCLLGVASVAFEH